MLIVEDDGLRERIGEETMVNKKEKEKQWTEKQLKEKIKDLEGSIRYNEKTIERNLAEIQDMKILLKHYHEMLAKKYDNPSSVKYGGPKEKEEDK